MIASIPQLPTAGAIKSIPAETRSILGGIRRMVEDAISIPWTSGASLRKPQDAWGCKKPAWAC
jgi:hypothetical protein